MTDVCEELDYVDSEQKPVEPIQTENINAYMKVINKIPRITIERENELSQQIHSGDNALSDAAREELICSNLRLVVKIAHDFKRCGMSFADLVAEGNCGLMVAADRFDYTKGAKFSCYAAWWIKQSIRKAIAKQSRIIRIPGGAAQKLIKMQKIETNYVNQTGKIPTDEELSVLTGFSVKTIQGLHRADIRTYSMDDKMKENGNTTFGDMLPEETNEESVKKETDNQSLLQIKQLLLDFPDRDRWVLNYSYGLEGQQLSEALICQETGLTPRQLEDKRLCVIKRLKQLAASDSFELKHTF